MTSVLEQAMILSVEEKLQLIEALWDSMARNPESITVPDLADAGIGASDGISSGPIHNSAKLGLTLNGKSSMTKLKSLVD